MAVLTLTLTLTLTTDPTPNRHPMQAWNASQLQPWWDETNAALCAVATEWWVEALRCFCLPIASAVAMAGLKEHAAKLQALVPPEKGPAALGVYPAAAEPTAAA